MEEFMDNEIVGIAQSFNNSKVAGEFQAAVAKKVLDVQKQEGNAMLQLLQSATLAEPGSPGSKVNIRV
jgi:hypothetical protein